MSEEGNKMGDSEQVGTDLHSALLLPLTYSKQLAESLKRKVLHQIPELQLSKEKVEEIRSEWESIVNENFAKSKSDIVSMIESSKIANVDPEYEREFGSILRESDDFHIEDNVEKSLRQFNAKFDFERKKHLIRTLRKSNEALTKKCDAYEEKIRIDHKDICNLYDSVKQDLNLQ